MAEPGDPKAPDAAQPEPDMDEAVGFASPASLAGRTRQQTPASVPPPPEPEPGPDLVPEPEHEAPARAAMPERVAAEVHGPPPARPAVDPTPAWARETPQPAAYAGFGTRRDTPAAIEGASGLYSVYALILFAVPTLGVSAVIALLAVTGRPGPTGDVAASHFVFQQRTLWAGAVVALAGAILVVVGLGVFVLFALAVWLIVRGAAGVLKLKAGRAMPNPRGWLI